MLAVGGNAGAHHPLLRDCSLQGKWAQMKGEMDGEPPPYLPEGCLSTNANIFKSKNQAELAG